LEPLAQNVGKTNRLEHGWETSLTSLHGEEAAEGGRGLSGLATDRAAEVALVCEAEFGGEACDVGLSVGEAVEGGSHAQPDAMAGDGVSGDRMENAAEVVRGDAERARQVTSRHADTTRGDRLPRGVYQAAPIIQTLPPLRVWRARRMLRRATARGPVDRARPLRRRVRRGWASPSQPVGYTKLGPTRRNARFAGKTEIAHPTRS
jgi:hypothetical protein